MSNLLLPLPEAVSRYVSTDLIFMSIRLSCKQVLGISSWIFRAIENAVLIIGILTFKYSQPDSSSTTSVIVLFTMKIVFIFVDMVFLSPEIEVEIAPDYLSVCTRSSLLPDHVTWNAKSIKPLPHIQVDFVYGGAGCKRAIRVCTEEGEMLIGEKLSHDVQDCVLAEIKAAYLSWGMFQV